MREEYPSGSTCLPQWAQTKPLSFFEKRLVCIFDPYLCRNVPKTSFFAKKSVFLRRGALFPVLFIV